MNLDDITVGISQAIYNEFGEDYTIYSDDIRQGMSEPCFLVLPINSSRELIVGNRYESRNPYDIHYFPQKENDRSEINTVEARLYGSLEYIAVNDGLIRGINMNSQVTDGVLHFFVDYNMFLNKKLPAAEEMQKLSVTVKLKE